MTRKDEDTLQTTNLRTLWSETLIEMLYDAVQYDWSANALREILVELQRKGYKIDRVVKKINKKFGVEASARLLEKIKE